ncbi:hypothetical protein ACELLULO517_28090 [Acidisoma cellulosilytica]|uniref:GT-D fold-like domain-containing protein n=1 Tax=Acidisoma cellulosilyticum TaxID=2802395 RepID=A0A963Z7M8_9PROT|nr:hypothetical protein [Acidisoma cellulosilyticum]MCB8884106.1 hypothetical protein [Acidisoma cellulosilyticum]
MHNSADIEHLVRDANNAIDNLQADEFLRVGGLCIESSIPPRLLAQLAIKARQRGLAQSGRILLEQYIKNTAEPNEEVYVELAFQKRIAGDHQAAAEYFSIAARLPKSRFTTKLNYVHMLFASGLFEDARVAMASLASSKSSEMDLFHSMSEFGDYLEQFSRQSTEKNHSLIKSGLKWLKHDQVASKILHAIETRSGFSLIRVGDGEGAFLRLNNEDESRYANLYDANRQNRMAMWFGSNFDWRNNGFFEDSLALVKAIESCDILAIPDIAWLRNGYSISSQSGIPSLVNIVRFCSEFMQTPEKMHFTTASTAKELQIHGHFEVILRVVKRVTVISCLPDLPTLLRNYFGISQVTFIQIPGEQGSRAALGDQVSFAAHYPEVYKDLLKSLEKPWGGELVLIAGGFLGKLYASKIKEYGGIALDIGSLADRWLGKKTRPGDDPRYKLDF